MSPERQSAIYAMQNMGWQAKRLGSGKRVKWEFRRPDTGGLWDVVRCSQANLSMYWVSSIAMQYGDADDLVLTVSKAKDEWLRARFKGIYECMDNEVTSE